MEVSGTWQSLERELYHTWVLWKWLDALWQLWPSSHLVDGCKNHDTQDQCNLIRQDRG